MSTLRLLIVEDSTDDAELIRLELRKLGLAMEWRRVETEADFVAALDEPWDLIISDYQMPSFDGLRAFALYKARGLDVPFIFVSGALGEERAVEAMRVGARDYLLKGNLARLNAAVRRELREAEGRRERRAAEELARREQRRLAMAVEASGAGIFEHGVPLGEGAYISERGAAILGYEPTEVPTDERLLAWVRERVHDDDWEAARSAYGVLLAGGVERCAFEVRLRHREGRWVAVGCFAKAASRRPSGRPGLVVGVTLDLTEQQRLEAQLRQAQKMEAVGRLAGGVAHDFNNLLTAIFSFGAFALEDLADGDPARGDLEEILSAARRAKELTGQLLAFSRRQPIAPRVIQLNGLVTEMDRMLRRVVGEDVDVSSSLAPGLWNVRVDPGSIEQVLVNLAVNARDAMPDGGHLTIETSNASIDEGYGPAHGASVPPGEYVVVAVSDDGAGMDEETRRQIFEPFFTTKEPGRGTGLGLSTCYGIVKQASGFIWVYSEPGKGSTFKVYLPRVAADVERIARRAELPRLGGSERILVVEDDDQVRQIALRALERLGYRVEQASTGAEAIRLFEGADEPFDLLLTDVVMPEMSGKQLVERLCASRPGLKVVYMSGYTSNAIVHRGVLEPGVHLLQKPFTPTTLAEVVRTVLDGPAA